jgi:hypothetical protein
MVLFLDQVVGKVLELIRLTETEATHSRDP